KVLNLSFCLSSDDIPVIETDSDLDQSEEDDEKDSGQQISDCGSESADENTNMKELEISGYVSDGDDLGCTLTSSKLDSDVFSLQSGEGSKRSVRDWLRSAQAMLQTPQKPMDRQFKTPEDSTKKKRNGGLAERLNRLQCRQRSAISFWRHKSISDTSVAVLEVHEESSMQMAHCEHQQPPRDGQQQKNGVSEETTPMLVLFNRETAAQLIPAPGNVIHIYPPWLCVLVQDSFGIFSVVRLQPLSSKDELHQYCQMWQGRTCVLTGVKSAFSCISSVPCVQEISSPGPPPRFCYLLSGHQRSVEPREGQTVSPLYLHPASQTLRDILHDKSCCCSFIATVLYKRMQQILGLPSRGEVWLVLTDPSLQEEQPERPCRRTVALCVSTSCVLTSSVLEALNSPAVCEMSFRDAIREHGRVLYFETTTRQDSLSSSEPQVKTLPQPLRLDSLSLETAPNSLCSLTGVIIGVDENAAYSWPACNLCGSDNLEVSAEKPQNFHCISCKSTLDKPDTKVQLEVFLSSSSLSNCTLKVKACTKSILRDLHDRLLQLQGYDVESVLGKEVGPMAVYVRVVTRKPAQWMGLEEICLQAC
uniref:Scaffold protein involved in DNA repair n=1 Tax=Xiphophorus couchianus TaxID=32473 RepID=A0A3B5M9C4_9TELE